MDRFERDFENLDVHTATMERTMDGTTVLNAPKGQVEALIQEAADKAGYVSFQRFIRKFEVYRRNVSLNEKVTHMYLPESI